MNRDKQLAMAQAEDGYTIAAGGRDPRVARTFTELCREALDIQPDRATFTLSRSGLETLVRDSELYAALGASKPHPTLLSLAVRDARAAIASAVEYISARGGGTFGSDIALKHLVNSLASARDALSEAARSEKKE